MKIVNDNKAKRVTLQDLLNFVDTHKVPLDIEILVEHLDTEYLATWCHYASNDESCKLIPLHNGFGFAQINEEATTPRKVMVLWQHS